MNSLGRDVVCEDDLKYFYEICYMFYKYAGRYLYHSSERHYSVKYNICMHNIYGFQNRHQRSANTN